MVFWKRRKAKTFEYDEALEFLVKEKFSELLEAILPLYDGGAVPGPIDPTDFPEWVPDLIVVEIEGEGDATAFTLRYFGGDIVTYYGERQGEKITRASAKEDEVDWIGHAYKVMDLRRPLRLHSQNVRVKVDYLDIESLLLPVSTDGGKIDRIYCFGNYVAHG